jgi:hypothetical protein
VNKVPSKDRSQALSDSMLSNTHRAKKYTDQNDPKNPNRPKFIAARGMRIRSSKFVCYKCENIFSNGWKYKTSNLGAVTLCDQCKIKIVPLKKVDAMAGAIQGGSADGGR